MPEFEALIRMAATGVGATAIAAPVFSVMRGSDNPRGRSTGRGAVSRTWPAVLLMAVGFVALGFVLWRPLPILMPAPVALMLSLLGVIFYFRRPMYVGVLLAALGAALIFRTWGMTVFLPMSIVVVARAGREEVLLAEQFKEAWSSYVSKVPKWFPWKL